MTILSRIIIVLSFICCYVAVNSASSSSRTTTKKSNIIKKQQAYLEKLSFDTVYPKLSPENSAVIEWGHSAIISALDASVAKFGPQTSQAALMEVECQPILASPLNGVSDDSKKTSSSSDTSDNVDQETLTKLDNADDVHGNMVVMTNTGELTGVQMAQIAKNSGAVALLIVNVDQEHPDEIYPLEIQVEKGDDPTFDIDIPVVMISLNSANVLTTATVEEGMDEKDIVNNGMPERIRLYAGGDRPFFEDILQQDPTLYLIHNLLTESECDNLVKESKNKFTPIEKDDETVTSDILQILPETSNMINVDRFVQWTGGLKQHSSKQIDERIEQVTGFPGEHFSDWIIERYTKDSFWGPHYDAQHSLTKTSEERHLYPIMATVTIFLTDYGPSIVYPSTYTKSLDGEDKSKESSSKDETDAVKILPRKGVAVVHHNIDDQQQFDISTIHGFMTPDEPLDGQQAEQYGYIARKHIFLSPISKTRRFVLPLISMPFGGKLPSIMIQIHQVMVDNFGIVNGSEYFDKLIIFIISLTVLGALQVIAEFIKKQFLSSSNSSSSSSKNSNSNGGSNKKSTAATAKSKRSKKTKSS